MGSEVKRTPSSDPCGLNVLDPGACNQPARGEIDPLCEEHAALAANRACNDRGLALACEKRLRALGCVVPPEQAQRPGLRFGR